MRSSRLVSDREGLRLPVGYNEETTGARTRVPYQQETDNVSGLWEAAYNQPLLQSLCLYREATATAFVSDCHAR